MTNLNMTNQKSGGSVRRIATRMLASGVLLSMYALGMIATTGAVMTAGISPAQAQRGRGRGWGGGGDVGLGLGIGLGAAMIGGAIAAQQAQQAQQQEQAVSYCMRRYRSFDPGSMTYVGRDGARRPCP
jgi:hypothetical protein